jgi:hypothetical protein
MVVVLNHEGTILGWVLVDLDDPGPKRLFHIAEKTGLRVEDLIELACVEKADRIDAGITAKDRV